VISSGYPRAVFTAQSVMLGMFPDMPLGFFDDADPEDKLYESVRDRHLAVHLLGMDCAFAMGVKQKSEYTMLKKGFFREVRARAPAVSRLPGASAATPHSNLSARGRDGRYPYAEWQLNTRSTGRRRAGGVLEW